MDTALNIGAVLVILGIIGSIIPAMPGPVLSFSGIVLLFFAKDSEAVSVWPLVVFGISLALIILAEYLSPILGARLTGAGKNGMYGAVIGAFIGVFFLPPMGIFIGALVGAISGEYYSRKNLMESLKAALGIIFAGVVMLAAQIIYSVAAALYYFSKIA